MPQTGNGGTQDQPDGVNRKGRTPDYIVEQRVRRVWFWMLAGFRTGAIHRLAARAHGEELAARAKAKRERKPTEDYPPLVWAVDRTPVNDRTVDTYIARAKEMFEFDGRSLPKEVATQLGVIVARLNDLYANAYKAAKADPPSIPAMNTCERLIRLHAELFGIPGSIKPTWLDPDAAPTDARTPETTTTGEQAEQELRGLVATALRRMGRNPADVAWIDNPPGGGAGPAGGNGGTKRN